MRSLGVNRQIAFYGSTPAYKPVLDLHGRGALHEELHQMSRRQQWAEMGELITDDVTRISPSANVLQRPEK